MVKKIAKSAKVKTAKKNKTTPKKAAGPKKSAGHVNELRLAAKASAARRLNKQ
jgi:hypothetical protein